MSVNNATTTIISVARPKTPPPMPMPMVLPWQSFEKHEVPFTGDGSPASEASSTQDFYDANEKIHISTHEAEDHQHHQHHQHEASMSNENESTTSTTAAPHATQLFDERYLSSEEALSPLDTSDDADLTDSDADIDDYLAEIEEAEFFAPYEEVRDCDMAIAVCFIAVGKPKIVDISFSSTPSIASPEPASPASTISQSKPPMILPPRVASLPVSAQVPVDSRPPASETWPAPRSKGGLLTPPLSPPQYHDQQQQQQQQQQIMHHDNNSFTNLIPASARLPHTYTHSPSNSLSNSPSNPNSLAPIPRSITPLEPEPAHFFSSPRSRTPKPLPFLSTDPFSNNYPVAPTTPSRTKSNHSRLRSLSQKFTRRSNTAPQTPHHHDGDVADEESNLPHMPPTPATLSPRPKISFLARKDSGLSGDEVLEPGQGQQQTCPVYGGVGMTAAAITGMKGKMVPRGAAERAPVLDLLEFLEEEGGVKRNRGLRNMAMARRRSLVGLGIVGGVVV